MGEPLEATGFPRRSRDGVRPPPGAVLPPRPSPCYAQRPAVTAAVHASHGDEPSMPRDACPRQAGSRLLRLL